MGFRTFDCLTDVPTYDTVRDVEQRLDMIVDHTKAWLNNKIDHTTIAQIVEHNYNHLIDLALDTKHKLEQSLRSLHITANIDEVISTLDIVTNN
jgi:hypothetical protein